MTKPDQIAALYRSSFPAFLRFAFRELYPHQKLIENWHVDVLADRLERVARGEIKRLLVTLPPRSLKTFSASIALPTWMLGRYPHLNIVSASGTTEVAHELARASRELMSTARCRALFPHFSDLGPKGDVSLRFGGRLISRVVGKTLSDCQADLVVVDAPVTLVDILKKKKREAVQKWFDAEVVKCLRHQERGSVILVMHRLHHDDICGKMLRSSQAWDHLNIPAVAVVDETWKLPRGRVHVRRKKEALIPAIEDYRDLFARMIDIGADQFAAQYQQAPLEESRGEGRTGFFALPDDQWGLPKKAYRYVSEKQIMAYEVFGIGDYHPAAKPREYTAEEWFRMMRWSLSYSNRIKVDPTTTFGPPPGEAWPPDPNVVFPNPFDPRQRAMPDKK